MSVYLSAGDDQFQAASNRGWSDFGEWADALAVATYPLVVQLWEHGVAEPAGELAGQLAAAAKASPPTAEGVPDTVAGLTKWLDRVPADEPVVASDGTQPEGGADDSARTFRGLR